jgi:hypothetical protein
VGAENLNPLDELKSLDHRVELISDLSDLKPIFARVDEIAKQHSDDFEVQLVAGDIKQHLVNRGSRLKAERAAAPQGAAHPPAPPAVAPGPPAASGPKPPPPLPNAPTVRLTPGAMTPQVSPNAPTVKLTPGTMPPPIPAAETKPATPPPLASITGFQAAAPLQNDPPPTKITPPGPPQPPAFEKPTVRLMSSDQFAVPRTEPAKPDAPRPRAPIIPPPVPPPVSVPPGAQTNRPTVTRESGVPQTPPGTPQQPPMAAPPNAPVSNSPQQPPRPPQPGSARPPAPPSNWRRPLIVGALLGAVVSIALIAILVNQARKRNLFKTAPATIEVEVATMPPGASIRVNQENKCTSPCKVPLAPGTYQVVAFLDGYDPATAPVNVVQGQAAPAINLTLAAQAQTVRILTDLEAGKIAFDDQPPADLQEGQFILDKVAPGPHTVRLTAKNNTDATFTFEIAEAKPPAVTGTVTTHNLSAVIVSTLGNHARVVTNAGPLKLAVNGQPEGDAGPAGLDLKSFQPGVDELVVGDGKDARNMKESFGPQPMLTAFLKSDLNIGTLIVSTGEDDVKVFINNKEYRRKTQRGQLRIPTIGNVSVRVEKPGFDAGPAQTAEVKKGAEVRLEFKMKAQPQTSSVQITGGTPGAEVLIDQKSVGTIGADGTLTYNGVQPGDHTVEIRRDQFTPKRFQRSFRAGQPVALGAADAALAAANTNGTIRIARTPADAHVTYRRADETQAKDLTGGQIDLPAGSYIFSASAPGFTTRNERVLLGAGETRTVELALSRSAPTAPALKPGDITGFEEPGAWKKDGELWTHRGGGFVPYGLGPRGVYTFTVELLHGGNVFKGGRIRWAVQYVDSKNYQLFELDRKNFWAEVIEKGKKLERAKTQHDLEKQKAFTIQIELTPDHVVHKIKNPGGDWITLDSFAEPGRKFTEGKFGFLIQGNDEIGISDFSFQPK